MPNWESTQQIRLDEAVLEFDPASFAITKDRDALQPKRRYIVESVAASSLCPNPMTRLSLIALRNAGQLQTGCHYTITDHVQGQLVAGTTIQMHAVSASELSENVSVNTTYDNDAWRGIYDIDRALVLELTDSRMNTCTGFNGIEVSNFDWGNIAYYGNRIENATFTVTIGNAVSVQNNDIRNATVNLTGFTGQFYWNRVHTAAIWNLTNANGTWRYNEVKNGGSLNMSGYLGGGDNYYNEFDGCTFNFTGLTGASGFRQNEVLGSSWTISGSGTCTITSCNFVQQSITRNATFGSITLNLCTSRESGSISVTGTGALSMTGTQNNGSVQLQSTGALSMTGTQNNGSVQLQSTGALTVNYSRLEQSSVFRNSGTAPLTIARTTSDGANSSIYTDAGSATTMTVTDCVLESSGLIRVVGAVGGGNFSVSGTRVASSSYIYKRNTGSLSVSGSEIIGASGLDAQSGTRSYIFNRIRMSEAARATLTGTGAVTDSVNEMVLQNRGGLNITCSGAANTLNYNFVSGLSGQITLSGTTGGQVVQRTHCIDATFTLANCTAVMTHDLNQFHQAGNCTVSNLSVAKPLTYCRTENASISVTGTVAGSITRINARNGSSVNISGTTGTVNQVDVSGGSVTINGGVSHFNLFKTMGGTLTTGNFTTSNIAHHSSVSKTLTANNTSRADYLGVASTLPLI